MSRETKVVDLEQAKNEAYRFISSADDAIDRLNADKWAYISGCKEVAAAKRASMDLSRALAEVRKPK